MARIHVALAGALSATIMVPAAAEAQYWGRGGGYAQIDHRDYGRGYGRGYDRAYRGDDRAYGYGDGYRGGRRGPYGNAYRGGGRYRCNKGTGGTIIGAIAGGLLGNTVAGRGDRGVGTIVGAGVGALAGRSIDRDC